MAFFQQVEGDAAIIVSNGVYQQVDLYTRDGGLFVKAGGGFVRLYADGSTSKAKTRLDFISYSKTLFQDSLGRLCNDSAAGGLKAIGETVAQKLLGGPANG